MAIPTLVQHKSTGQQNSNVALESAGGNSYKLSLPNPTLANNCLVLGMTYAFSAGRTVTITDDKGNSWPGTPTVTVNNGTMATSLFVLPNVTAGTIQLTIVFDATTPGVQFTISEFYNVATVSPVNGTTTNSASTGATVTAGSFTPGNNDANGGNLIWNYATDTQNGTSGGVNLAITAVTAGAGFTLHSASRDLGIAAQLLVQTTAAAVNPTLTFTGNADTYNSVAVALKAAVAGTAPGAGIRIVHDFSGTQWSGGLVSPFTQSFPCSGNLLVCIIDCSGSQTAWTGTIDSHSNLWTQVTLAGGTGVPQVWFAANAVTGPTTTVTFTYTVASSTQIWRCFDIAGAAVSPLDVEADATGSIVGSGDTTAAPLITPTTANGLILAVLGAGTGPDTAVTISDHAIFDNTPYVGETDAGQINNGDAWQHIFTTTAAPVSIIYHLTQTSAWDATAVAFKAAPPVGPSTADVFCYPSQ